MNYLNKIFVFFFVIVLTSNWTVAQDDKAKDKDLLKIIKKMSVKEKVGQMTQINIDVISVGELFNLEEPHKLDTPKLEKAIKEYYVGSFLNAGGHDYTLEHWRDVIKTIQDMAMENKREVPIIYGIDAIHGAGYLTNSTLFPQPLAQAATFNPDLVKQGAAITAYETRASGIPWNFSPVLDVARQPLWSRVFETYGEDVYLCTELGKACVEGYQGDDISDPTKVAACLKHFYGYSWPFTGKDRTPVYAHERTLREYFLPPFQAAINEGAASIMINSGELNGIPVHIDKSILTDLLRSELGFEGVAVTDWEDIYKLHRNHNVAASLKDAVRMAIDAGVDMSMTPLDYQFNDLLIELVDEGEITEERLDQSVYRILKMKKKLGLFENPYGYTEGNYDNLFSDEFQKAAYNTAAEGITLLKNEDNILPLKKDKKVFLTGPAADSRILINGAWTRTWQGTDPKFDDPKKLTIRQALENNFDQVDYVEGSTLDELKITDAHVRQAMNSDVVVVCLAEKPSTEIPGNIDDLNYNESSIELIKALEEAEKNIVLVLVQNRPRIIREIEPLCSSIIMAYQFGDNGAQALADIISGKVNPSGKLPITYPKHTNTLLTYDHKHTEKFDVNFGTEAFDPQFEFGDGLSYTSFEYSDLKIDKKSFSKNEDIQITVNVKNTGNRAGKETVLLFIADDYASVTPSVKRLRGFQKKNIEEGKTETYTFNLNAQDLAFIGIDNKPVVEKGSFTILINDLKETFEIQ